MGKLVKIILLVLAALFCWGWVSHVVLGKMTTGQYLYKLRGDFQRTVTAIIKGSDEVSRRADRIANNTQTLYGPGKEKI